jgi:hypothetical protein
VEARDTDTGAHRAQLDAYRAMGPARRVRMVIEMSERARRLSIQGMQRRHPGMSSSEARARVLRRTLGDELFEAAWPDA